MKLEIISQFLVISSFLLIGGIVTVSGQNGDLTKTLTDEDIGQEVCLQKGKRLSVRLIAQLATGFSWQVTKNDPEKLKLVSETTEKAGEDEVNREIQIFNFKAIAKGDLDLELGYSRPWEKDRPPAKKYNLKIIIR